MNPGDQFDYEGERCVVFRGFNGDLGYAPLHMGDDGEEVIDMDDLIECKPIPVSVLCASDPVQPDAIC